MNSFIKYALIIGCFIFLFNVYDSMDDFSFDSITGAVTSNIDSAFQGASDLVEETASGEIFEEIEDYGKPEINIEQLEKRIHELMNEERKSNGLNVFSWNDKIAQAARYHSDDMAARNFYSHDSPEGNDFLWRYHKVGFNCEIDRGNIIYQGAENIHQNWLASSFYSGGVPASYNSQEDLAQTAVSGWMNSPGHRQNILTPYFTQEGIGVGISENGKVYFTQNFC